MTLTREVLRKKGGRRTYSELQKVLKQWQAAQSGTKPVKTVETGFLSGGRLKGKLTDKQHTRRDEIKDQIKTIKQAMRKEGSTLPETDVARRVRHASGSETPPTKPTETPKPKPTTSPKPPTSETPPTKPVPRTGSVVAAPGVSARKAALMNLSSKNKRK